MSEDSEEKPYDPSPDRLRKARAKGNIPLSQDVLVLATYLGALIGIVAAGAGGIALAEAMMPFLLTPEATSGTLLQGQGIGWPLGAGIRMAALIIAPAAGLVVAALIVKQGIVFAPTKMKPDLNRINPVKGAKRKFGAEGMTEFLKSAIKIVVVSIAGGLYLWGSRERFADAMAQTPGQIAGAFRTEALAALGIAAGIAALVAAIDLPLKIATHRKGLRMSRQEVVEESKEMEGDPAQKQARRQRAKEAARVQMLRDVEKADVVVVNPTHYAVALKWERSAETVPVCVAKGVDHLARTIIDRARSKGVPVREDPPCARALYATVDVGDPIEPEHFIAVAAAIRFADRVRSAPGLDGG